MNYKDKRKYYGLTLEDIAKAVGVTRQAVYNFEFGINKSQKIGEAYQHLEELRELKYEREDD